MVEQEAFTGVTDDSVVYVDGRRIGTPREIGDRLTALEAERDRLRARTHEIQERADKEIAPLRRKYEGLKAANRFLVRMAYGPVGDYPPHNNYEGLPNTAYWYRWERALEQLAALSPQDQQGGPRA